MDRTPPRQTRQTRQTRPRTPHTPRRDRLGLVRTFSGRRLFLAPESRSPPRIRKTLLDKILPSEISPSEISPEKCGVCLNALNEPDALGLSDTVDIVKLINCRHKFHKDCILGWGERKKR